MPITFGPQDLLEYNAKHRVLICRECKYAIQKSALGNHLLRHKIYRGDRQRLLSSIARLDLTEPDDVQFPPAGSRAVDGLPVLAGYRCTSIGCGSLCASLKRTRRHWSDTHGVSDSPETCACPVHLQTFFRGTKIRYFEVASPPWAEKPPVTDDRRPVETHDDDVIATTMTPYQNSVPPSDSLYDFNLETLRYFHHLTTTASLTLPTENHEPARYWQTNVIEQALQLRWIMCGLLGISASHMAALSNDEIIKQTHQRQSVSFVRMYLDGWEEVKRNADIAESEEKIGAQMTCILRCYHWTAEAVALDAQITSKLETFTLQSFMASVRGCIDPGFAFRDTVIGNETLTGSFAQAANDPGGSPDIGATSKIPSALFERLRALPYRMAEALETPNNAQDFFETLSAINLLTKCFTLSYAYDNIEAVWEGMVVWLRQMSRYFHQMIDRRVSAALIVLAHWTLLVRRAEEQCWFLRGLAKKVLRRIMEEFRENNAARSLIEDLLG